jgi:hypothetical protein
MYDPDDTYDESTNPGNGWRAPNVSVPFDDADPAMTELNGIAVSEMSTADLRRLQFLALRCGNNADAELLGAELIRRGDWLQHVPSREDMGLR